VGTGETVAGAGRPIPFRITSEELTERVPNSPARCERFSCRERITLRGRLPWTWESLKNFADC
jgi:hypothetical protein